MIQIGDALIPTLWNIVSKSQAFVVMCQGMDEGTGNIIIRIAAFVAAIGPVHLLVEKLTTGTGRGLHAISSLAKGILTFTNQAKLSVGAGGKLATAIAGIVPVAWGLLLWWRIFAAVVSLWKNNEEFRNKIPAI